MKIGIALLMVYAITTIIGIMGCFFAFLFIGIKGVRRLAILRFSRGERPKTELPLQMVGIFQENALEIEGIQPRFIPKFVGVRLGEFILLPDSDSEMRSEELRVTWRRTVLVVQGGSAPLRIRTKEGFSYAAFLSRLSQEDKVILKKLASDLAGWVWPEVGEVLRRRIEELGEDNVLRALRSLYKGVEETRKRGKFHHSRQLLPKGEEPKGEE